MKRDLSALTQKEHDLLVVGGGIYGASVARDAALRGLRVALVEQGDFGSATSANNHKILHGGLRYLQHGDLVRMRESIRERSILMRTAPHLTRPMPFLIPTYGHSKQGKLLLGAAIKLNDLISFDRNRYLKNGHTILSGRVISKAECLDFWPELRRERLTGGVVYFDGQLRNSDRFTLSVLISAATSGADLANYVRVTEFLRDGNSVTGVRAEDVLTGNSIETRAKIVINCTGPWIDQILSFLNKRNNKPAPNMYKAVVLVTRSLHREMAVGVPCGYHYEDGDAILDKGYRYFFITPWRDRSLIGTFNTPHDGASDNFEVTEKDIRNFLKEINQALPTIDLKRRDVHYTYGGLLPATQDSKSGDIQPMKKYKILDHARDQGSQGLISVVGVKYTTARDVAEKAVNMALVKLGSRPIACRTHVTPVHGGKINQINEFIAGEVENGSKKVSPATLRHLIDNHGSEYREVLSYCDDNPEWGEPVDPGSPVIKAQVVHGVRYEMARSLEDVILRRTELGTAGYPGDACLKSCADVMAGELGWDEKRTQKEISEVKSRYSRLGCVP